MDSQLPSDTLSRTKERAAQAARRGYDFITVDVKAVLALVECAEAVIAEARSIDVQSDMIAGEKIMLAYRRLETL